MKANRLVSLLLALLLALPAAALAEGEELTNADGFVYILGEDGSAEIIGYTGKAEKLEIPAQLDGHPVTAIGGKAFESNQYLTEVTVPDGVTAIRVNGFSFCSSLTAIRLPEGLRVLEYAAITNCNKLKTVNLPDSVTEAGDDLFGECKELETVLVSEDHPYFSVVDGVLFSRPDHRLIWYPQPKKAKTYRIPEGTEIIGVDAFNKAGFKQVIVPESVKEIHTFAFFSCKKLQKVNIPSQVTKLEGLFPNCTALQQISVAAKNPVFESKSGVLFNKTEKELILYPSGRKDKTYAIPKGTRSIARNAFNNGKFSGITIPGSVKTIGTEAFMDCNSLKKVVIPEGVEELGHYPFSYCKQLTEVSLPRSLTKVTSTPFIQCPKLKTVKLAADHPVLTIKNNALIHKKGHILLWYPQTAKAKKYTVPKGVKHIGSRAFENCVQLNEVVLPEGVEMIFHAAFFGCTRIKAFTLPASLKMIDKSAFLQDRWRQQMISATYTVPRGSYAEDFCKSYKLKTKVK